MKDSNTWQSLIDSVWGLQDDLFVVISTNSIVQPHHCCSVCPCDGVVVVHWSDGGDATAAVRGGATAHDDDLHDAMNRRLLAGGS